jgi:membrane-associated phospholipid phosphatase
LLFFLVPTAPPWLASDYGELSHVDRVMDFVGAEITPGDSYTTLYESLGVPNAVAAMPSIHMGVTFGMFLWAWRRYPRLAAVLLMYSLLMGASLVYMAEHYVADLLVGMACALVMFAAITLAGRRWRWLEREPRAA